LRSGGGCGIEWWMADPRAVCCAECAFGPEQYQWTNECKACVTAATLQNRWPGFTAKRRSRTWCPLCRCEIAPSCDSCEENPLVPRPSD